MMPFIYVSKDLYPKEIKQISTHQYEKKNDTTPNLMNRKKGNTFVQVCKSIVTNCFFFKTSNHHTPIPY